MATVDINIASRLPNNIEAERAVLGAILLNNSAYNEASTSKLTIFPSIPTGGSIRGWWISPNRRALST
jgi:hypothetical protein